MVGSHRPGWWERGRDALCKQIHKCFHDVMVLLLSATSGLQLQASEYLEKEGPFQSQ